MQEVVKIADPGYKDDAHESITYGGGETLDLPDENEEDYYNMLVVLGLCCCNCCGGLVPVVGAVGS